MEKICKECGKSFEAPGNQHNLTFCSMECRKTAERRRLKESRERRLEAARQELKENDKKPKVVRRKRKPSLTIGEIAVMARKEHMTYGQYVGKYGL